MDLASEKHEKKEENELQDDQPRRGMESLSYDVTIDILSRLPITSLRQVRFVSRAWNLLSCDPNLAALHFSRTARNNPYLIFHSDYPIRNQLCFVELSDQLERERVRKIKIPFHHVMPEFNVIASCNGLLCLSDSLYVDPFGIYNPFTGKYKELPKSRQYDDQVLMVGFGFHPLTKEYKVVKIVYYWNQYEVHDGFSRYRRWNREGNCSEVQIFCLGNSSWRSIGRVPFKLDVRDSQVLFNGRLHSLTQPLICRENGGFYGYRNIISFDLQNEKFQEVPRPNCGGLNHLNYHLVVLQGCLSAMVCICQERLEIWVMKEYNVKESWTKQFILPEYSKQFLRPELQRSYKIWKNIVNKRSPRVVCLLENGDILMEYMGGSLVSHDPYNGTFKKLRIPGMPDLFQTVVHVGSLIWIETNTTTVRK